MFYLFWKQETARNVIIASWTNYFGRAFYYVTSHGFSTVARMMSPVTIYIYTYSNPNEGRRAWMDLATLSSVATLDFEKGKESFENVYNDAAFWSKLFFCRRMEWGVGEKGLPFN